MGNIINLFRLIVRRIRNTFRPNLKKIWLVTGGVVALFVIFSLIFASPNQIIQNGFLCMGGLVFWMFFFSQFVLPVKTVRERGLVFNRLWNYIFGDHGPAVMIMNGKVVKRDGEMQQIGRGVILLDAASAAVLRTPARVTRTVGPGVVFTDCELSIFDPPELYISETILGSIDLHVQKQKIGPWENDVDPFAPKTDHEPPDAYKARQDRRRETFALTRDGIEVVPDILVTFRLKAHSGEGGTGFGFRKESVKRATLGRSVDLLMPSDAPDRRTLWTWLPPYLAADVWRELLSKFTLKELFQSVPNQPSALETIRQLIRDRLMKPKVSKLDDFGHPTNQEVESQEFRLLEKRGIEVISVTLTNLRFPAEIEDQLVNHWKAGWLQRAKLDHDFIEQERSRASEFGRATALIEFAKFSSHEFVNTTPGVLLSGGEILLRLLRGDQQLLRSNMRLQELAQNELKQIEELIEWAEEEAEKA